MVDDGVKPGSSRERIKERGRRRILVDIRVRGGVGNTSYLKRCFVGHKRDFVFTVVQ